MKIYFELDDGGVEVWKQKMEERGKEDRNANRK
jgi:hypothetical protein